MLEVREELIKKYLDLDRTREVAEKEVDSFLSDRARSEKFLEMRRIAKEAEIGAFTPVVGLQLASAFFIGLGFDVASKHWVSKEGDCSHEEQCDGDLLCFALLLVFFFKFSLTRASSNRVPSTRPTQVPRSLTS